MNRFILLLLIIICLGFVACEPSEPSKSDIQFNLDVSPNPPQAGIQTTIYITLTDSTGQFIQGADVSIEATMTHPGMKPLSVSAEEAEPGRHSAPIEFTMAGDWFAIVSASLPDGKEVEKNIPLPTVKSSE